MWFDRFSTLITVKKLSFVQAGKVMLCRNRDCTVVPSMHFSGLFKLWVLLVQDHQTKYSVEVRDSSEIQPQAFSVRADVFTGDQCLQDSKSELDTLEHAELCSPQYFHRQLYTQVAKVKSKWQCKFCVPLMYDSHFCLLQQNRRFSLWIYLAMVFSSALQLDSQPLPYTGIFAQELSRGEFSRVSRGYSTCDTTNL